MRRDAHVELALVDAAEEAAAGGGEHQSARRGIARTSASTARIASSMAARLVPSGALTPTSNSASSTSLGMYSCRTSL